MEENNFFKSNFVGRDGFNWWIGQIADEKSYEKQVTGGGFGYRYKVRIMGYHPYNTSLLPDDDLPFAHVMLPPGSGTGSGQWSESIHFNQGDVVIGFFLDGDNGQVPIIMGMFGNSKFRSEDSDIPSPFKVFSGYSKTVKPSRYTIKNEVNDNSDESQPSPESRPREETEQNGTKPLIPDQGKVSTVPCKESSIANSVNEISASIENFVKDIRTFKAQFDEGTEYYRDLVKEEIAGVTEHIRNWSGGIVGPTVAGTYEGLVPILQGGLDMLYKTVYGIVLAATGSTQAAHKAGVKAQEAMVGPVKAVQDLYKCIVGQVLNGVADMVEGMLNSIVDNVANFADCMVDQFVGGILNGVIDRISGMMTGVLGGVSKILTFFSNFSVDNMIRNSLDLLSGLVGFASCNKRKVVNRGTCKYINGIGEVSGNDVDMGRILGNANVANAAKVAAKATGFPLDGVQDIVGALDMFDPNMKVPGFKSALGACYSGFPTICGGPKINIFGGRGSGANALALMGNFVGEGSSRTGSVISIKVADGGSGYLYPPFVEVTDNCNKGYGAHAQAILKDGKVDSIYIVTEGEGYPVEDDSPLVIDKVIIVNPGTGYGDNTFVTDQFDNEYDVEVFNGSIVRVTPINNIDITEIPIFEIIGTGDGAQLSAVLTDERPPQGEVKQVIDCVS